MNHLSVILGSLLFLSTAHARPCRNLWENSCWHAENKTQQKVELTCSYFERILREIFVTGPLLSGTTYSEQFDQGWADGLGFFVDNLNCEARYGQTTKKIYIPNMPAGAHIKFFLEPNKLKAVVESSYGRPTRQEYESRP